MLHYSIVSVPTRVMYDECNFILAFIRFNCFRAHVDHRLLTLISIEGSRDRGGQSGQLVVL